MDQLMTLKTHLRTLPDSTALERLKYDAREQNLFWGQIQRAAGLDRRVIEETIEKNIVAPQMKEEYDYLVQHRPHRKKVIAIPLEGDPEIKMSLDTIDKAKSSSINLAEFYEAGLLQQVLPGFRTTDLRDFDTEESISDPAVLSLRGLDINRINKGGLYVNSYLIERRFTIRRFNEYENKAFPYVFTIDKNKALTTQGDFNGWLRARRIDSFVKDYASSSRRKAIHFFSRPRAEILYGVSTNLLEDSLHSLTQRENSRRSWGFFKKAIITCPIWGITQGDLDYLTKNGKTKTFDECVRLYHLGKIKRELGLNQALIDVPFTEEENASAREKIRVSVENDKKWDELRSKSVSEAVFQNVFGLSPPSDYQIKTELMGLQREGLLPDDYQIEWVTPNEMNEPVPQGVLYAYKDARDSGLFSALEFGVLRKKELEYSFSIDPVLVGVYNGFRYPIAYWK
ncbi:hypothetical protein A3K73_06855 [Candidatus Pacearchaeota archaeon RBG_13_36_9]|nr:MAG: hypothetical protein A3K73_06855 [Candidatus Pacearchaeota archaeon RBG_13_36_9]